MKVNIWENVRGKLVIAIMGAATPMIALRVAYIWVL